MIYTIGHTKNYLEAFETDPNLKKLGQTDDYPGGSVWKTRKEAENFLSRDSVYNYDKGYSVFGVLADWETQTEENDEEEYNNLLVTSKLVKL